MSIMTQSKSVSSRSYVDFSVQCFLAWHKVPKQSQTKIACGVYPEARDKILRPDLCRDSERQILKGSG